MWSWNVDSDELNMDEDAYALWGLPEGETVCFEDLSAHIHPSDRDRVRAAFAATRAILGSYEIDFRIMIKDEVRWISARGQGNDADILGRVMFGIFLDVTGRKQAEEGHELLAGEMSHRVKNLLAIASGLTAITSRLTTTTAEMARELTQRLTALGRAHDLVRPLPGREGRAALLGDLLTVLLAPYDDNGAFSGRIRVAVPRMGVGESAATALALVIHELATNSLKYGALSTDIGTLDVACHSPDGQVVVVWTERGGPEVARPAGPEGYGSKLVNRSMADQLGGSIEYDWDEAGVIVTLRMTKDMLAR
jgi:two-component sensor histidine kinase